jgi:hypothetical protein
MIQNAGMRRPPLEDEDTASIPENSKNNATTTTAENIKYFTLTNIISLLLNSTVPADRLSSGGDKESDAESPCGSLEPFECLDR